MSDPSGFWGELVKTSAAGVAGGIIALFGSTFDYFNRGRELDIRMVDVALTILAGENKGTDSEPARLYALSLLNEYGGVPITIADRQKWAKSGDLPIGIFPTPSTASYISPGKSDFSDATAEQWSKKPTPKVMTMPGGQSSPSTSPEQLNFKPEARQSVEPQN